MCSVSTGSAAVAQGSVLTDSSSGAPWAGPGRDLTAMASLLLQGFSVRSTAQAMLNSRCGEMEPVLMLDTQPVGMGCRRGVQEKPWACLCAGTGPVHENKSMNRRNKVWGGGKLTFFFCVRFNN